MNDEAPALVAGVALCAIDRPRGRDELRRARESFERSGDRVGQGYGCFLEGLEDIGEGRMSTASDWWERSCGLLDSESPVVGLALAHLALGAYAAGDLVRAEHLAEQARVNGCRRSDQRAVAVACMYLAFVRFHTGAFAGMEAALDEGITAIERIPDPANRYELPMLLGGRGCLAAFRGDAAAAEAAWAAAIACALDVGNRWYEAIVRVMRADCTVGVNPVRAVEDCRHALDYFSWAGEDWWVHWARTALVAAHREAGALSTAAELGRRLLGAPLSPLENGRALATHAETLMELGDAGAVPMLEASITELEAAGAHYWAARSELLLAPHDHPRREALRADARARAGADVDDEAWVRLFEPAPRERGLPEWPDGGAATGAPARAVVAELVAQGFTSRQIAGALNVAPSTVETHVRAAMRDHGVRTRAELAAAVRRPVRAGDVPTLAREQLATLELLAGGRTIVQIAAELHFSRRTVERRLTAARLALGVSTNQAAAARAQALGLVVPVRTLRATG